MEYGPAPEDKSRALSWIKSHGGKFDLFIGGKWVAAGGKRFAVKNPATGDKLAMVAQATPADVDKAVRAAKKAQSLWQGLSGHQRAKHIYALARLIQKHARILAVLETLDNGKTIRETRDIDIPLAARHFYYHAGWAQIMDMELPDYEAHGVVGQIIPWNFPFLMLAWKIAPAIAAGNTVVLKPAEQTPLSALYFCELVQKAGIPEGVINILTGDGETGKAIVAHKGIAKIAFTGSTEVGKYIRESTAGTGKELTLELGGKSPYIVFADADLDSAVEGVVDAIWFNQGEVCCAGSRLLVAESIADKFYKKLKRRMDKLRVGDPLDKAVDMGALVDDVQVRRVNRLIDIGAREGGKVWQSSCQMPNQGCYVVPTLITEVEPASTLAQEEVFGPVLAAMTFRTPKEAIALANNTRYGLAASIWSENINVALDMAANVKAGVVWVNSTNQFDAAVGFGGYRESGFGREGGIEGMMAYVRPKPKRGRETLKAVKPVKVKSTPVLTAIDRTPKMYIGGQQKRPDGNNVMPVVAPDGTLVGEAGLGNRKDIRNAVEAAAKASGWSASTALLRAQIIYYIGENLDARRREFATRLRTQTGMSAASANREVDMSIERLFACAAYADKFEGVVHSPPVRDIAIAMNEPLGAMGIVAPQNNPLFGFISVLAPVIASGNRAVIIPSDIHPLSATDFYQVLETSDVPAGVVNIVTGNQLELAKTLAEHDEIAAMWYFGHPDGVGMVERVSVGNLKQTWSHKGKTVDWRYVPVRRLFQKATQVKNIWVPYGA
ncbi:MAG TPA: aldehyde dehydrogenase family protein [Hellea balneolensis]|uniref:Aldehyde dehydrogenase family protein n=1 Tax=Hellea balneolensis TaxID=287478 RepID=A0A7C5QQA1_9PROT|nr:aldehyde dehydrogenase family protein [Hellea balneolensis]